MRSSSGYQLKGRLTDLGLLPFLSLFLSLCNRRNLWMIFYAKQPRMSQLPMHRPLNKPNLHDNLRSHPVRAHLRQTDGSGKRRLRNLELIQLCAQIHEQLRVKTSSNLPCEHEVVTIEVANKQRAKTDTLALWICEPADDEFLRHLAFHLQPMRRAAMLVQ